MTHEDMERAMEFVLEHQGKFASDLSAFHTEFSSDIRQLREMQATASGAILTLLDTMGRMSREIDERFRQTDERFRQTDERIRELADAVAKMGERLNSFVTALERFISRDGKGKRRSGRV